MGVEEAPSSWKIVKWVFFRKPDAEPKKGLRSWRAVALTSDLLIFLSDDYAETLRMAGRQTNKSLARQREQSTYVHSTCAQLPSHTVCAPGQDLRAPRQNFFTVSSEWFLVPEFMVQPCFIGKEAGTIPPLLSRASESAVISRVPGLSVRAEGP